MIFYIILTAFAKFVSNAMKAGLLRFCRSSVRNAVTPSILEMVRLANTSSKAVYMGKKCR